MYSDLSNNYRFKHFTIYNHRKGASGCDSSGDHNGGCVCSFVGGRTNCVFSDRSYDCGGYSVSIGDWFEEY